MKAPKTLFATVRNPKTEDEYFDAETSFEALFQQDDGTLEVGEYRLVRTFKASRQVHIVRS